MKDKTPRFLKPNRLKKVKKSAFNPKAKVSARKKLKKAERKRYRLKTLSKIGFEYKDRKDVW